MFYYTKMTLFQRIKFNLLICVVDICTECRKSSTRKSPTRRSFSERSHPNEVRVTIFVMWPWIPSIQRTSLILDVFETSTHLERISGPHWTFFYNIRISSDWNYRKQFLGFGWSASNSWHDWLNLSQALEEICSLEKSIVQKL